MTCSNNTKRNPWLDNLKAFAIYLVIAGHVLANCMPNGGGHSQRHNFFRPYTIIFGYKWILGKGLTSRCQKVLADTA